MLSKALSSPSSPRDSWKLTAALLSPYTGHTWSDLLRFWGHFPIPGALTGLDAAVTEPWEGKVASSAL